MDRGRYSYLLMTIPALLLFFVFHTSPALQGVFYSFTNWRGFGDWNFVGLRNYINVFRDSRALDAYLFTFKFAVVSTIIVNTLSLTVALGLNASIKFKNLFRALYFFPNILSILIIGFIFNYIFGKILPPIAQGLGIESLSRNILGNPDTAWIGVSLVAVWQASAFNTIIYLAGLQTIPEELYEASVIDGAGTWKKFWHITFPLIAPFFTINMVLAMKGFLQAFGLILSLTGGGPGRATETISIIIYRGGFQGGEFAYQSANAVIYLIFLVTISLLQIRFLQKREMQS
ncbi:MAG: sugar ABC transporter permease [Spirochaetaceae bacterium]|nr:sugar ABC transporter permease [Spirochaetaceae bacterium]